MPNLPIRYSRLLQLAAVISILGMAAAQVETVPAISTQTGAGDAASTSQPERPTVDQLISAYVDAVGGRENWERHSSRRQTYDIAVHGIDPNTGEKKDLTGTMVVLRKKPNLFASISKIEEIGEIRQGFDGEVGWSISPAMGARILHGQELSDVRRDANLNRDVALLKDFATAEVVGERKFDGHACWELRLSNPGETFAVAFFDKETHLLVGLVRRLKLGGAVVSTIETRRAFTEYDGIKLPSEIESSVRNNSQTLKLRTVEFDVDDPSAFDRPAEIQQAIEAENAMAPVDPASQPETQEAK